MPADPSAPFRLAARENPYENRFPGEREPEVESWGTPGEKRNRHTADHGKAASSRHPPIGAGRFVRPHRMGLNPRVPRTWREKGEVMFEPNRCLLGAAVIFCALVGAHAAETGIRIECPESMESVTFGMSVDVYGEAIAVGSPDPTRGGAVQIYTRSGIEWEPRYAVVSPPSCEGAFGMRVALQGNRLLIGSPARTRGEAGNGAVYIYSRSNDAWELDGEFEDPSGSFGRSIALAGNRAAVGSPTGGVDGAGEVCVLEHNGTSWVIADRLTPPETESVPGFGSSVSLRADRLLIGASGSGDAGGAYLYAHSGGTWSLEARFTPPEPGLTTSFGRAVALSDDVVIVSGRHAESSGTVFLYEPGGSGWAFGGSLHGSAGQPGFGMSLDVHGNEVAVATRAKIEVGQVYSTELDSALEPRRLQTEYDGVSAAVSHHDGLVVVGVPGHMRQPDAPGFILVYPRFDATDQTPLKAPLTRTYYAARKRLVATADPESREARQLAWTCRLLKCYGDRGCTKELRTAVRCVRCLVRSCSDAPSVRGACTDLSDRFKELAFEKHGILKKKYEEDPEDLRLARALHRVERILSRVRENALGRVKEAWLLARVVRICGRVLDD